MPDPRELLIGHLHRNTFEFAEAAYRVEVAPFTTHHSAGRPVPVGVKEGHSLQLCHHRLGWETGVRPAGSIWTRPWATGSRKVQSPPGGSFTRVPSIWIGCPVFIRFREGLDEGVGGLDNVMR